MIKRQARVQLLQVQLKQRNNKVEGPQFHAQKMNHLKVPKSIRAIANTALFIALFSLGANQIFAQSFSDVPPTNPDYAAIESLKNLQIIKGYSDGTFRPAQAVNRAEALKMVLLSAKVQVDPGLFDTGFPDVKISDWFSGYIFVGQNLKIVNGNADGTFAPARQVNKAEFLKMTEQAFKVDLSKYQTAEYALARDIVNVSDWFVPYLNYAKTMGIISPTIDDKLEPSKNLTRADCAEILYKMYIVQNGGETQQFLSTAEAKLVDSLVKMNNNDLPGALSSAQDAVFYTDNALKNEPDSNVTQGASLISNGFEKLFEAYSAANQNDAAHVKSLLQEANDYAAQATAKDASLQNLSNQLKTLAAKLSN